MLCIYGNVSPTKWKRQHRVRCGAGGPGGQGPTGAAVRIRAQDYRITRRATWTGRWWERKGEGRRGLPQVLKHKKKRTRDRESYFSHYTKGQWSFFNYSSNFLSVFCVSHEGLRHSAGSTPIKVSCFLCHLAISQWWLLGVALQPGIDARMAVFNKTLNLLKYSDWASSGMSTFHNVGSGFYVCRWAKDYLV